LAGFENVVVNKNEECSSGYSSGENNYQVSLSEKAFLWRIIVLLCARAETFVFPLPFYYGQLEISLPCS
jgi:hypothetical protein